MNTVNVEDTLQVLVGLTGWAVRMGPAGMHWDFGHKLKNEDGNETGSYSLFIECPFWVARDKQLLFAERFVIQEHHPELEELLLNQPVERISIDPADNSQRLLLPESILLSAFPNREHERTWFFCCDTDAPPTGFVVFRDKIKGYDAYRAID